MGKRKEVVVVGVVKDVAEGEGGLEEAGWEPWVHSYQNHALFMDMNDYVITRNHSSTNI